LRSARGVWVVAGLLLAVAVAVAAAAVGVLGWSGC
jgi:hypothetical protein